MGKKLYVGNLAYGVTDSDLTKMFETHGTVESAQVIMDRDAGRSKGLRLRRNEDRSGSTGGHRRPEWPGFGWPPSDGKRGKATGRRRSRRLRRWSRQERRRSALLTRIIHPRGTEDTE